MGKVYWFEVVHFVLVGQVYAFCGEATWQGIEGGGDEPSIASTVRPSADGQQWLRMYSISRFDIDDDVEF